jgi:hypothetical protein
MDLRISRRARLVACLLLANAALMLFSSTAQATMELPNGKCNTCLNGQGGQESCCQVTTCNPVLEDKCCKKTSDCGGVE